MEKQIVQVRIVDIKIPEGRRELDLPHVGRLAESMRERGQFHPICLTEDLELISGNHRVEAKKLNGEEYIDAVIWNVDDIDAELMEIDENLFHQELSKADRMKAMGRRKELYEARYPETRHGGNQGETGKYSKPCIQNGITVDRPPAFVDATAKKMGLSKTAVARDIRIGNAFTRDEIDRMDKGKIPTNGMDKLVAARKKSPEAVQAVLDSHQREMRDAAEKLVGPFDGNRSPRQKTVNGQVIPKAFINSGKADRAYDLHLIAAANLNIVARTMGVYYYVEELQQLMPLLQKEIDRALELENVERAQPGGKE